jgi:hypothetical protein
VVDPGTTQKTPPTEKPKKRKVMQYPKGGPKGPVVPPGDDAYEWLATGRCQKILDRMDAWKDGEDGQDPVGEIDIWLYEGAASACLSRWDVAIDDFNKLRRKYRDDLRSDEPVTCEKEDCPRCRRIVFEWLSMMIDAHRADPDAELFLERDTGPSACPPEDTTTTETTS